MNEEENIAAAKKDFEASFKEGKLYDRQTQDTDHLERIIEVLHIQTNDTILDLGTGTGYVSFEIAKRYKNANVIGLDIVEKALQSNRKIYLYPTKGMESHVYKSITILICLNNHYHNYNKIVTKRQSV